MELKYIVYITINLCNGKFYIGVHKTNPEVFDGYIGNGIYGKRNIDPSRPGFHRAVKKYGYENFKRTTIQIFPDTDAGRQAALDLEKILVNSTLLKSKTCYNLAIGGGSSNSKLSSVKEVYMFSIDGKFIEKYDSPLTAALKLRLSDNIEAARHAIVNNCCKRTQSAFGYFWSYTKKFEKISYKRISSVAQYTISGKFLRHFDSTVEAETELGIENIYYAIIKKGSSGNYQWRYYNGDSSNIEPLINNNTHYSSTPILMYDLKGNLVSEYNSVEECILKNPELTSGQINRVLRKVIKTHKGFVFKYKKDEDMI